MNQDGSWDPMVQDQDSDFIDFLNASEFNIGGLDFGEFDTTVQDDHAAQSRADDAAAAFAVGNIPADMSGAWDPRAQGAMDTNLPVAKEDRLASQHQHPQHTQHYAHMHGHMAVPPTPDSMEMHGRPHFQGVTPQQARVMYENYPRKQQEQMVFTPLVSPAVTPLDTQFQIPEYAVPGEYFSPLTSPAMPAQVHQRSVHSSTSEGASPSDMEIDGSSPQASTSSAPAMQKGGRKSSSNSKVQKSTSRGVRQSPVIKAQQQHHQKRKLPTSSAIATAKDAIENGTVSSLRVPGQGKASESGSASPEPMSEVLMPPPATPRSVGPTTGRSPMLGPQADARGVQQQQQHQQHQQHQQGPVTPATLMRLQQAGQVPQRQNGEARGSPTIAAQQQNQSGPPPLRPNLQIETRGEDDLTTPTLSARDGVGTVMTPRTVPASPSVASSQGRPGSITSKGKKRNSTSQPSPALRPRISPSIKPLLPEGAAFSAESSALLLASKSNYQNLLEGNKLPGVTYPNELSANLTSKRTSHKLAEQGRRNRMNTALQELASLLPNPSGTPTTPSAAGAPEADDLRKDDGKDGKEGGKGSGGAAAKEGASKASTVEMAIDLIRALQAELGTVRGQLAAVEGKLGGSTQEPLAEAKKEDEATTSPPVAEAAPANP